MRIGRPIFQGDEVAFLRFVASLAGIVLAGGSPVRADRAEPQPGSAEVESPQDAARRRVAMAAHDLRNPLSVLNGYVDLLAEGGLGELSEPQSKAAEAMRRQVDVLARAIDRLMELDRAEPDLGKSASTFELRTLFDELAETRFPHAAGRLTWPGPESAFEFDTDRDRLISIVQNLVDNALRHGGDGRVVVDCSRRRRQLLIRVRDEGAGLDPAQAAALEAGPHARATRPVGPESGLGLPAVAEHVAALGGKLDVATGATGGTTITVQIPARRAPAQAQPARPA